MTSVPPFTAAAVARINCIGVIAIACPKPMRAASTGLTCSFLRRIDEVSPTKSIPVFSVKPKSENYSYILSAPIRSASAIKTQLQLF